MTAFRGKRRGTRASDHLQLKPSWFLRRKLDRLMAPRRLTRGEVHLGNICAGILRSRGEKL